MDIEFLKKKAQRFWKNALNLYSDKVYDLAAFNLEQTLQIYLKYLIAKKIGEWPHTHYLSTLIKELSQIYEKENILEFYSQNELFFDNLEDAYFISRYFPKEFTQNSVSHLIENCKRFFKFLEQELNEKFNENTN